MTLIARLREFCAEMIEEVTEYDSQGKILAELESGVSESPLVVEVHNALSSITTETPEEAVCVVQVELEHLITEAQDLSNLLFGFTSTLTEHELMLFETKKTDA